MAVRRELTFTLGLLAICVVLLGGCLARQVGRDGKEFRQSLLNMYTDQVMDNLIRAHNYQPFVQLAYSDLTVQGIRNLPQRLG